jgi:1-acyl-sn-glycerol-3-phosphate acyltransferase
VKLPPLDWWRSVFVLVPLIAVCTVVLGTLSLASTFVDRSGEFAHRCARWWSKAVLWISGVRVDLRGVLPPDRTSCIFVANHASFFDIPVVFTAVPRQLRIIAKAALAGVPFIGWHLQRAGHLLVDRANPGASILRKMRRMTQQGASLIVFPEGSRSRDGNVGRFKGGVFVLALDTGLPIVPISVRGTHAVMPPGRLAVHPATVSVTVHEAIPTAGKDRSEARALANQVHEIIARRVSGA